MNRDNRKKRKNAGGGLIILSACVFAAAAVLLFAFLLFHGQGGLFQPAGLLPALSRGDEPYVPLTVRSYCGAAISVSPDGIASKSEEEGREYLNACADELQRQIDSALGDREYYLDSASQRLSVVKGYGGLKIDRDEFISGALSSISLRSENLDFYSFLSNPVCPDFQAVYDSVCAPAKEPCFSEDGSHTVLPGQTGITFDVLEAISLWGKASIGERVDIPLNVTYPSESAEYLESMMYRDLLGAVTTKYNNSGPNRCSNVRLAASLIDGTVLFPGEEFSFNKTVGKRTEEAGFLLAPAYAGYDDIKEEIGGGVCQVSTGLYAASLYSFIDIVSHTCHVYPPNYIQLGCDATVSIPESGREIDLKIRNSRNWPIRIVAYCEELEDGGNGKPFRTVTVEIWGTLEDDDYMPVAFDNRYADIYDYYREIEPAYEDRQGYRFLFTHDETEFEDDTGKGLRTLTYMRIYDTEDNLVDKLILNPLYSFGYGMDTYYYMK